VELPFGKHFLRDQHHPEFTLSVSAGLIEILVTRGARRRVSPRGAVLPHGTCFCPLQFAYDFLEEPGWIVY